MDEKKFIGVYETFTKDWIDKSDKNTRERDALNETFKEYLWGKDLKGGLSKKLKRIQNIYGNDLKFILFKYNVDPLPHDPSNLGNRIDRYRPKEKSIGVWVNVTREDFFEKNEDGRREFMNGTIICALIEIEKLLKKKKFDTDMDRLIEDVKKVL